MTFKERFSALSAVLFIVTSFFTDSTNCDEGQLVFASVIFRHGDRTPVEPYPNDPYADPKFWPVGFGQLTNTGKQQHFELGKWFRKRYNNLVSVKYNNTLMRVRSTDVDRTLMSAQSNLAGFYPPVARDVWNSDINWQPIPIHTMPESQDSLLAAKKLCPVYEQALKGLYKSEEFKSYDKLYKPLYKYLTLHTGKKVDSIQTAQNIYNCLFIEELYNYTLPEWTKEVYPDKLYPISGLSFAVKTYTPLLARLKSGPLLKEILDNMKKKTRNKSDIHNYYVYSGHDTTVANMLNTLGVFKDMTYHNPPYASTVMFELRKYGEKDYRVQVFYKNTTADPQPLDLPECGTSCPLDKMFTVYKSVLPVDWESECEMKWYQFPMSSQNIDDSISVVNVLLFIGVMTLTGMLVLYITMKIRRRDSYREIF